MNTKSEQRPRVVIVGGGFAGLAAAKTLRRCAVDVTLVDRRNFHLFQPLLYQVATGELSPSNISAPLRSLLENQPNARVLLGEVDRFDLQDRVVELDALSLKFDYLILATGSTHHYFGNDQWAPFAPGLKTVENATEIRRQILSAFEAAERCEDPQERAEILTFVIVGGGPTGCELAGALSDVAYHVMRKEFRSFSPSEARIVLVEPDDNPLQHFPEPLPARAGKDLEGLGVELVNGKHVTDIGAEYVELTDKTTSEKSRLSTRTVIWAAGVKASSLGQILCKQAGVAPARGGKVPVQNDSSVEGFPHVFVCGDLASFQDEAGQELPGLAPVASQMGRHAAKMIIADLKSKPRKPFRYFDKGSLAVIGRFRAVGTLGSWRLKGLVAWFLWLFVHLMYITQFRNRLLVLIQWGWTFFTHDRSSRLITGAPEPLPPSMKHATGWDRDPAFDRTGTLTAQQPDSDTSSA